MAHLEKTHWGLKLFPAYSFFFIPFMRNDFPPQLAAKGKRGHVDRCTKSPLLRLSLRKRWKRKRKNPEIWILFVKGGGGFRGRMGAMAATTKNVGMGEGRAEDKQWGNFHFFGKSNFVPSPVCPEFELIILAFFEWKKKRETTMGPYYVTFPSLQQSRRAQKWNERDAKTHRCLHRFWVGKKKRGDAETCHKDVVPTQLGVPLGIWPRFPFGQRPFLWPKRFEVSSSSLFGRIDEWVTTPTPRWVGKSKKRKMGEDGLLVWARPRFRACLSACWRGENEWKKQFYGAAVELLRPKDFRRRRKSLILN